MWCGCASAVVVADEDEGDDGVGGDDVVMLLVMMAAAVGGSHGGDVGWGWIGGGDEDGCGEVAGIRPEVAGAAPEIGREEEEARVEEGHAVLIHAAAGGVGSLQCQWANKLGATLIGTVSTKEKALQAKEDGCPHVIIYKEEDFVTRVNEITSGQGVDIVFDSVGKDTFEVEFRRISLIGFRSCLSQTEASQSRQSTE
ncbi:alcohol dehydrogenase superfamily protein [Tanacetum coccineum]